LHELPCIEKIADDAETLELALIENLQRKDLTPSRSRRLQRLAEHSITRMTTSRRKSAAPALGYRDTSTALDPDSIRKVCLDKGIVSKSLLLQVARQPNEKKMREMTHRITQGGLTRDEARRARKEETASAPRPRPFIFNYQPEDGAFTCAWNFARAT